MSQRISIDVTDALVASYKAKLQEAHAILNDLLVALPPEEAKRLFKIGLQRRGLPEDGLACAEANPDIMAGTYKAEEHRKDVRSGRNLGTLEGLLEQELKQVRDTRTLCESDGADWALKVYRNAVEALPEKPGIKAWVDTLGAYFERGPQPDDPAPAK
jgi:hypothetical protein